MKQISERKRQMLLSGLQLKPEAMVKVDIEPPFIGAEFSPTGSEPSFTYYQGVLYLTFIDSSRIKIVIVDPVDMKVISLFRTIPAAGASRPRLAFEISTVEGLPDLPHVAYTILDNQKAMVYREEYDSSRDIVGVHDEIGNGICCDTFISQQRTIDFFLGVDGIFYYRFQHQFAEKLIDLTGNGKQILWADVSLLPDLRFAVAYIDDGNEGIKVGYSDLFDPLIVSEAMQFALNTTNLSLLQTVLSEEQMTTDLSPVSILVFEFNVKNNEHMSTDLGAIEIQLIAQIVYQGYQNEHMQFGIAATMLQLRDPLIVALEEHMQTTLSVQEIILI